MIKKEKLKLILTGFILFITLFSTACNENNAFLNKLKGDFYFNIEKYDKAYDAYIKGYEKAPDNILLTEALAKTCFYKKEYKKSLEIYSGLLKNDTQNPEYLNMASLIYLETNDYNKALENIKIAITLDSDNEEYLYTQGLIYNGMNMHINALNSFKLALEIKPDFYKALFYKAEILSELSRYDESLAIYNELLLNNKKDDILLNNIGYIYSVTGKYSNAIKYYSLALKYNRNEYIYHNNLGDAYYDAGEYEESLKSYRKAIKIKENNYSCTAILDTLYTINNYTETLAFAKELIANEPENNSYKVWKAKALTQLGNTDESKDICTKILEKEPDNHLALDELGYIYYLEGYYGKALHSIEQAILINDNNKTYYYDKIMTLYEINDYISVIDFSEITEKKFGSGSFILRYKMLSYNELGEYEKALEQAKAILELEPDNPSSYIDIARELIYLQQYKKAKEFIEAAIKIDEYNKEAKSLLGVLDEEEYSVQERIIRFIQRNYLYEKGLDDKEEVIADFLALEKISHLDILEFIENVKDAEDAYTFFIPESMYQYYKNDESKIEGKYIDTDVFYIKINIFNEKTTSEFWNALRMIENPYETELVIDLRDNPGGTIKSGSDIIDILLPEAYFAYTIDKSGYAETYYSSPFYYKFKNIYIFVNNKTASTSEIMVLALKEFLENVTIIGLPTYGKGVGQLVFEDRHNEFILYLTSFHWNVKEKNLGVNKITPDIKIRSDIEDDYFKSLYKILDK
jgi:tetratricopeptide (TPR) repeat protein